MSSIVVGGMTYVMSRDFTRGSMWKWNPRGEPRLKLKVSFEKQISLHLIGRSHPRVDVPAGEPAWRTAVEIQIIYICIKTNAIVRLSLFYNYIKCAAE